MGQSSKYRRCFICRYIDPGHNNIRKTLSSQDINNFIILYYLCFGLNSSPFFKEFKNFRAQTLDFIVSGRMNERTGHLFFCFRWTKPLPICGPRAVSPPILTENKSHFSKSNDLWGFEFLRLRKQAMDKIQNKKSCNIRHSPKTFREVLILTSGRILWTRKLTFVLRMTHIWF